MQVGSKKIRIYPKDESKYFQALNLYRRAYNLAVAIYLSGDHLDENGKFKNLRPQIKEQCKAEQDKDELVYSSIIVDHAVLSALTSFKAVMKRNKSKKGEKTGFSTLRFKSRKGDIHSFGGDRFPKSESPFPKALGEIFLTEDVPEEAINKSFIVTYNKGRWYVQVQMSIKLQAESQGEVRPIAIDPGVRTFGVCYSQDEILIAGDGLVKDKLLPLMKKVDKLLSWKKKLLNLQLEIEPQWFRDRMKYINKMIYKLRSKKDDIILDLHNRLAHTLVTNYDLIFLPTFETKKMSSTAKRSIRRSTARSMLSLNHYQFAQRLKWYAKKYGKHVIDCNESYTSKTRSWDGTIDDKLGGKKVIRGDGFSVDRDINGARGILLKQLSKAA